MKFGFASALVLGGLLAVFSTVAQAQSSAPAQPKPSPRGSQEQAIIFSSPDGLAVSNALVPAAEAPHPDYLPDSSAIVPVTINEPQFPGVQYARPSRTVTPRNRNEDPADPLAALRSPTSAEIMGVPTLEQIFGLPKSRATNSLGRASGVTTNIDFSDNSPNGSPWDPSTPFGQGGMFASGQATNSDGSSSGFSGSAFGNSMFGQRHDSDNDSAFGAPPFQSLSSPQSKSDFAPPADGGFSADASAFAPKTPAPDSAFNAGTISQWSQSSLPQPKSLQSMPQLPSLPSYQINNPAPPARPSWEPKPPPWASSGPQLGTMTQPKF